MGEFGRQVMIWFASGLFIAAGSKFAEYLATQVTQRTGANGAQQPVGTATLVLCPSCGRNLRRFGKSMYCTQCGHKEG